jgi:hypothetical protein
MVPTEDEMRTQMFNTMAALGRMANAVTDHLTADKQPCETATEVPDYSSLRAICKNCQGVVQFEDYNRNFNSTEDTCTCAPSTIDDVDIPPNVKAIFVAVHAARACPPIVACPKCKRPTVVNDPTRLCTLCLSNAQRKGWKKAGSDADYFLDGNVVIQGDLMIKGTQTVIDSEIIEDCPQFDEILKQLASHRKALAIIGTVGGFENVSFGQSEPGRLVRSLVGLSACRECLGTGWLARDETCKTCAQNGYTKA